MKLRQSPQTSLVLAEFLSSEREWRYGYDLSRNTGLQSGTLYPILMRLSEMNWLESSWETMPQEGRPSRHLYRLTEEGVQKARPYVRSSAEQTAGKPIRRPAFEGAGS